MIIQITKKEDYIGIYDENDIMIFVATGILIAGLADHADISLLHGLAEFVPALLPFAVLQLLVALCKGGEDVFLLFAFGKCYAGSIVDDGNEFNFVGDLMNGYFLSTLSVIIILAFFDAIVSKTKNGKSVKIIISLFSTFLLLTPILKVFKGGDFNSNLSSISYYEEYLNSLEDEVVLSKIKFALNRGNLNFNDVKVGDVIECFIMEEVER